MSAAYRLRSLLLAALVGGAAALPGAAAAGSCCGGGGGQSPLLPSGLEAMLDLAAEAEIYHGFWNRDGEHVADPAGSDLRQYRLTAGYAHRFSADWQGGASLPYVWNVNTYAGTASRSQGLGDSTVALWYEAVDEPSIWKLQNWRDAVPALTVGLSLLLPTGASPYDDVDGSFQVTGRGFYRLDGNLVLQKTYIPWGATLSLGYGTYFERPVNREYGRYVEPYRKDLGDRLSASAAVSYGYFVGSAGDTLTGAVSVTHLRERDQRVDGARDAGSGFRKTAVGATLTYSSTDHDWSARGGWSHAVRRDGWGENFPTTDTFTLGVRHGFR